MNAESREERVAQVDLPERGTTLEPPAIVSRIIRAAVDGKATDIHIDPVDEAFSIRFRVDGVIHEHRRVPSGEGGRLVNQVKVVAGLGTDITYKPQESTVTWREEAFNKGMRVTIVPTIDVEAVHIRILAPPTDIIKPEYLGMREEDLETVRRVMSSPENPGRVWNAALRNATDVKVGRDG